MNLVEVCVHSPVKVAVGVLLIVLFGVVGLLTMPLQLTPEVNVPTVSVETRWTGASPQEIEREIVREQEEQLKSVEGMTKMSSESKDGQGAISLEFAVGTDMKEALLKVANRLQQVREYPVDADEPVVSTSNISDRPIAFFVLTPRPQPVENFREFQKQHPELAAEIDRVLAPKNAGLGLARLRRLAAEHPEAGSLLPPDIDIPTLRKFTEDHIEPMLERVAGVSNANITGGRLPELQVIVDPEKLAARQLTITDVREALRGQNKDTSGGDFWEGKRRWVVRTLGQFRSPEQVEGQLLAVHDGSPVYVRDVAEVRLDYKKPDGFVRRFGANAIVLSVTRDAGTNVLEVMRGLRAMNQRLNDGILKQRDLTLTQVYDETDYIYSAIGLVNDNILVGGLLTVLVLLAFLRSGRSTIVIAVTIPISVVGTFLMMKVFGRSLNVISLAGLSFAVGMLIDNAIVVLENIFRHYQNGDAPFPASVRGATEVWGAIVATTLSNIAVFLPVVFIQEEAGQLFRDISLAITGALALSLIVCITVVPPAAARMLKNTSLAELSGATGEGGPVGSVEPPNVWQRVFGIFDRPGQWFVSVVVAANAWTQQSTTRRWAVTLLCTVGSSVLTWVAWPKVEYLPNGNRNLVIGVLLPLPGTNLDEIGNIGETIEEALRPYWDVEPDSPAARELKYPVIADYFFSARGRQVIIGLRAADPQRAAELVPLMTSLRSKLRGEILVASQSSLFERSLTDGRSIDIEITGPELTRLVAIGGRVLGDVARVLPTAQVRPVPSLDLSSPEMHVTPKLMQSRELQVSAADLGYSVDALVDGAYAGDYFLGGDKIDLTIKGQGQFVERTQDLDSLPIATPVGELVSLSALAEVTYGSGPEQVNHRERQRAITIRVSPPPDMPLEAAIERIEREVLAPLSADGTLGVEYTTNLSGTVDKLRQTWVALRGVLILATVIAYLLMAALFESWIYPLVVMTSVPLGAVGGILGLRLLGVYLWLRHQPPQTLDVLTMLGFVIQVGTAVNNAILIVHQALHHMRHDGMAPKPAMLESVRTRIRPIMMTTATALFGLIPLVFFPGPGSELYRGLGAVLLGSLVVTTVFTLVLVPALFTILLDLIEGVGPRSEREETPTDVAVLPAK